MYRNFALPRLGKGVVWFAIVLATGLPLAAAFFAISQTPAGAAGPGALRLAQGQAMVALIVLAAVLPLWRRQVAFDGKSLRVKAAYFGREAPLSSFLLDQARVVDLREHVELKPFLKTFGYALPGFKAGHFRLRDRRKAFCLVTDPAKVLALPHADGRVWLLSLDHPQPVLDILRRAAG